MSESLLLSAENSDIEVQTPRLSRIAIIISLVLLLIFSTTQNIVLEEWVKSFPDGVGGPYFIIMWSASLSSCFFGLMYLVRQKIRKEAVVSTRKFIWSYMAQGLANALNGVFVVYSFPITRTPPIICSLLLNMGVVFSMILTKYMIPNKRGINYFNVSVCVSLLCLAGSLGFTVAGNVVAKEGSDSKFGWITVFWMTVLACGTFFGALYNVLQELYLLKTSTLILPEQQNTNMVKTLFLTSLFQLMFLVMLFWVDLIPGFGYSNSMNDLLSNFVEQVKCFFFSSDCGAKNFIFGVSFSIGYFITYFIGMLLNKQSANFTVYALALQTPFTILVLVIIKFGTENTPLWSIIPSLLLVSAGIFIWKRWEIRNLDSSGHL